MKRLSYGLCIGAAVVVAAVVAIYLNARRDAKTAVPQMASASVKVEKLLLPLQVGEIKSNVPSLTNAAPPEFDAAQIDPKRHRVFQLARGEEHIVARPGDLVHLHIRGMLEKGWRTYPTTQNGQYANTTRVSLGEQPIARIDGEIKSTPPPDIDEEGTKVYGVETHCFTREFYFDVPLRVAINSDSGRIDLLLTVRNRVDSYEAGVCNPYTIITLPVTLTVVGAAEGPFR